MDSPEWDIRREPRAWLPEEVVSRWDLTPEKFELMDGKLFWNDTERLHLLAMLLENVGIDATLSLAPLARWREAFEAAAARAAE
jgi:hypothetical protein